MPSDEPTTTVLYLLPPRRRLECSARRISHRAMSSSSIATSGAMISAVRGSFSPSMNATQLDSTSVNTPALMILAYRSYPSAITWRW